MKRSTSFTQWMAAMAAVLCLAQVVDAQTIKLKITYNGAGVANNNITVKSGDAVIGRGKTDRSGDVSIPTNGPFPSVIDVYGEVNTDTEEKSWSVKQYCHLDDNHFFHLKMEEVLEFFSEAMDPEILAEAWGLVFSTGGHGVPKHTGSYHGTMTIDEHPVSGSGGDDNHSPEPEEPALPPGCHCQPVSGSVVNSTKSKMDKESFSSGKLDVAKSAVRSHCFDASQVKTLVEALPMSGEKMDLAKYAYDHVADPGNYATVESAIPGKFDREDLQEYISEKSTKSSKPTATSHSSSSGNGSGSGSSGSGNGSNAAPSHRSSEPESGPQGSTYTLTVFAEGGERFTLYLDGKQQNSSPESNVVGKWKDVPGALPHFRIVFEDTKIPTIDKRMVVSGYSNEMSYKIKKNNKGEYVLRL